MKLNVNEKLHPKENIPSFQKDARFCDAIHEKIVLVAYTIGFGIIPPLIIAALLFVSAVHGVRFFVGISVLVFLIGAVLITYMMARVLFLIIFRYAVYSLGNLFSFIIVAATLVSVCQLIRNEYLWFPIVGLGIWFGFGVNYLYKQRPTLS